MTRGIEKRREIAVTHLMDAQFKAIDPDVVRRPLFVVTIFRAHHKIPFWNRDERELWNHDFTIGLPKGITVRPKAPLVTSAKDT